MNYPVRHALTISNDISAVYQRGGQGVLPEKMFAFHDPLFL